ncbi:MAG TPA: energy-coupling factor ABC transporter permease [Verrucomicrobiae bacterium]|nr:energy-coupling factor ABC transporter permease [Verrucomicrobiae bacterium]
MHIPDGFIDGKTAGVTTALAVVGVGIALRQLKRTLPPRKAPLLGLSAAFLFAAQMVNFPVAAGTSGHLIGGILVAALLGPAAGAVVVTAVLIVQCFLFADGGVLALGANVFNMAILGAGGGFVVLRGLQRLLPGQAGAITAVAFAAWCSVVFAAAGCAGQLAWSDTVHWRAAFPAMTVTHMIIGIGEGLISALVVWFVRRTRPEMILQDSQPAPLREVLIFGSLATIGLVVFVAPFASPLPDGLERVALQLGFEHRATAFAAPIPDYEMPGMSWAVGATALAGVIGAFLVFAMAWALGRVLVPSAAASERTK